MFNCLPINCFSMNLMAPLMSFNPFAGGLFSFMPMNFSFMPTMPTMPSFNYMSMMPNMNSIFTSIPSASPSLSTTSSKGASSEGQKVVSSNQNLSYWESLGYNKEKGLRLANDAVSHVTGTKKWCAKFVKSAIARCGLGKYQCGNGKDMTNILKGNSNFKQISVDNVNLKALPAGTVLVYGAGVSGYSPIYGHTQVVTADGKAASDHIEQNIRKPSAIFIPV